MTEVTSVSHVPDSDETPRRTVRVSDDIWEAAQRVAADQGETVTDVVIRALVRYIREHPSGGV